MASTSPVGRNPHRRVPGWLPLRQGTLSENPPEEVHVRLYPKEGLIDGDETGNVQHLSRIEVL